MLSKAVSHICTCTLFFFFLTGFVGKTVYPVSIEPNDKELSSKNQFIYRIKPEQRGGEGFKLVYLVPVPIEVFWRFKTDFKGTFLLSNRYIKWHRFVQQTENTTITENKYTNAPGETFKWRTTLHPDQYRLEFQLENPHECGQHFHYGIIQLEPFGAHTKATHIAYFDFLGAFIWVNLPFQGGMTSFLTYTAQWERETVSRLIDYYAKPPE